jgi:acetylornithine deacetylase/succinyl-diaminopimelate desuccinylase-like protein
MKIHYGSIGLLSLLAAGVFAQTGKPPVAASDAAQRVMARELLQQLVEINTTQANGCTNAAEVIAARLRSGGFSASDVLLGGTQPDRQNVIARLRGRGQGKPILLIAHLDVVDAPRDGWAEGLDPFKLAERDGFFYGRGVLDDKNAVACLVANFIRLRAEGYVPGRDIIVALTADEESGRANGVAWLLAQRPDVTDVAYCLNLDAGGGQIENGKRLRMTVQTSEKMYLSFRLETSSPGGHSSLPDRNNAIDRLAAGLTRLSRYEFPIRFNGTTRAYFARMAQEQSGPMAADMKAISQEPPDLDAARRVADASPYNNAILRTTCVVTRMEAGHADNALPQSARTVVNCRIFPGDTPEFVRDSIVRALNDPNIKVAALGAGRPSPVSPLLPEVMNETEKLSREMWPGVPVLPVMDPWSSDSAHLRRAGITTFGLSGCFGEMDMGNAHGANERLPVDSFYQSVEFLYRLLKSLTKGDAGANP